MIESIGKKRDSETVKKLLLSLGAYSEICEAPDNDDYYINFKLQGVSLLFNGQGYLDTIFLYLIPKDGFMPYEGWIGEDIERSFDSEQVKGLMGDPLASGGGYTGMFDMYIPIWDKYEYLGVFMHYQFNSNSKKIDMLTIKLKDPARLIAF